MVFCPFIASSATFALKSLLYFFGELVMVFLLGNASLLPAILSHQPVHFTGTIIEHFKEAKQDYDKGLYRECLMKCRLIHEAVEDHLKVRSGPDHKLGEAVAEALGWTSGSEQEKFLTGAWKPLYVMANASAHTPSTKSLLPADAHTVLLLTAAMLEYLTQLE
jgi:hypothetical protein